MSKLSYVFGVPYVVGVWVYIGLYIWEHWEGAWSFGTENGGDKLVHGSGGISQRRAE